MSLQDAFELPSDARVQQTGGGGSLVSRVRWQHTDGSTATWESRLARKRSFIEVVRDGIVMRIMARPAVAVRLRRCNDLSGVSFFLGGGLFTLGALVAQYGGATTTTIDWTFLIGGIWFSTGAYAALVQELNSPRKIGDDGALVARPWRWWAYEPNRPGWVAAFVLFCGTLAFGISLVDAFLSDLSAGQVNRLIWAPEMVGCILFLLSGHIGILEVCHGRFRLMTGSLGWWIVIVNQIGSWLFMLSGLAAFVRPVTGEVISVGLINWGTASGAACFSVAGLAQLFERPAGAHPIRVMRRRHSTATMRGSRAADGAVHPAPPGVGDLKPGDARDEPDERGGRVRGHRTGDARRQRCAALDGAAELGCDAVRRRGGPGAGGRGEGRTRPGHHRRDRGRLRQGAARLAQGRPADRGPARPDRPDRPDDHPGLPHDPPTGRRESQEPAPSST